MLRTSWRWRGIWMISGWGSSRGWPGANPRDTEFFARAAREVELRRARLVAFGATRRPGVEAGRDPQVRALVESGAPVVTLVAKAHDRHVELALRTTLEENVAMVRETVAYLRGEGRRVFVDCEHFFDGYRANAVYARSVVVAAWEAGAEVVVLCDTNGGMLPSRVHAVVSEVGAVTGARLGIHAQDDAGCAVANTLAAVEAGASHVQCTANGYGERVGNADLFSVVAALELKYGRRVLPEGALAEMTRISHAIAEVVNLAPSSHRPYVGVSAFAHKAGLHASAIKVDPDLYQHVDPGRVGNAMRMLVSDMAGRASVELKGRELGVDLGGDREVVGRVVERVKERESRGYTYEAADASFELLLREETEGRGEPCFELESWRVIAEDAPGAPRDAEATVKLRARGTRAVATAEGDGPVHALDRALRRALRSTYPEVSRFELVDYKVRILEGHRGTAARTRVLVSVTDGHGTWQTVGVAGNALAASCEALVDAYTYGLRYVRRGADGHAATEPPGEGPGAVRDDAACTLTVTLRNSRGALGRIAATLSSTPVLALSYTVADAARATAEIRVPRTHAVRARGRLNRMVEALAVTEPQPVSPQRSSRRS
ncbi:citramalate synthase [Streptomyces somaliensis]|nr:citramalate synthase [Streptomyces somaliensis]